MKITLAEKTYCFELSTPQMRRLVRRDALARELAYQESMRNGTLSGAKMPFATLLEIPTVSHVEYDGMFGPYVWVTIEEPSPDDTLQKVKRVIEESIKQ